MIAIKLFLVLWISLAHSFRKENGSIILIDRSFKTAKIYTDSFSVDNIFKKQFPIYTSDLQQVEMATEKVAKTIDRGLDCNYTDTIKLNHSTFIITMNCKEIKNVTIILETKINNIDILFPLVSKEQDLRKAQISLLDFQTYLD
jgi:hypothetical protein